MRNWKIALSKSKPPDEPKISPTLQALVGQLLTIRKGSQRLVKKIHGPYSSAQPPDSTHGTRSIKC